MKPMNPEALIELAKQIRAITLSQNEQTAFSIEQKLVLISVFAKQLSKLYPPQPKSPAHSRRHIPVVIQKQFELMQRILKEVHSSMDTFEAQKTVTQLVFDCNKSIAMAVPSLTYPYINLPSPRPVKWGQEYAIEFVDTMIDKEVLASILFLRQLH